MLLNLAHFELLCAAFFWVVSLLVKRSCAAGQVLPPPRGRAYEGNGAALCPNLRLLATGGRLLGGPSALSASGNQPLLTGHELPAKGKRPLASGAAGPALALALPPR